jgi:hypothetical protein
MKYPDSVIIDFSNRVGSERIDKQLGERWSPRAFRSVRVGQFVMSG